MFRSQETYIKLINVLMTTRDIFHDILYSFIFIHSVYKTNYKILEIKGKNELKKTNKNKKICDSQSLVQKLSSNSINQFS